MFYRFLFYFVRLRRRTNKLVPTFICRDLLIIYHNPYTSCRDRFTGPCVLGEITNLIFYKYIFYALRKAFYFKFFQFTFFLHFFFSFFTLFQFIRLTSIGPIYWSLHLFLIFQIGPYIVFNIQIGPYIVFNIQIGPYMGFIFIYVCLINILWLYCY